MCTRENEIDALLELGDEGKEQKIIAALFALAERKDANGEGEGVVDEESFCNAMTYHEAEKALRDLDVYLGVKPRVLFNVLDTNGRGTLDVEEFADGLVR